MPATTSSVASSHNTPPGRRSWQPARQRILTAVNFPLPIQTTISPAKKDVSFPSSSWASVDLFYSQHTKLFLPCSYERIFFGRCDEKIPGSQQAETGSAGITDRRDLGADHGKDHRALYRKDPDPRKNIVHPYDRCAPSPGITLSERNHHQKGQRGPRRIHHKRGRYKIVA